jgi:hypothetical protein
LPEDSKIAIVATGNWYYFYELLEGKNPDIRLAHPLKTETRAPLPCWDDEKPRPIEK